MKSAREQHKLRNFITNNLKIHDVAKNSRRSNSKNEKGMIIQNSSTGSIIKMGNNKTNNKKNNVQKKIPFVISRSKLMRNNLFKHNSTMEKYYIKITNDIIYDERKHIVCMFKDYLLWDENSDFLKRFYFDAESTARIPKISAYYEKYSIMRPVYFRLNCCKIMLKNVKKHKKRLEAMEENEDNENEEEEEKEEKEVYSKLLKTSLLEEQIIQHSSNKNNNIKVVDDADKSVIKQHLNFEDEKSNNQTQLNLSFISFPEERDQSVTPFDSVSNIRYTETDNFNSSNNMSIHSHYKRLNFLSEENKVDSKSDKNQNQNKEKSKEIIEKKQTSNQNKIKEKKINLKEKEKVTLMVPVSNNKNLEDIKPEGEPSEKLLFKKIEFNKLNLKNINNYNNSANINNLNNPNIKSKGEELLKNAKNKVQGNNTDLLYSKMLSATSRFTKAQNSYNFTKQAKPPSPPKPGIKTNHNHSKKPSNNNIPKSSEKKNKLNPLPQPIMAYNSKAHINNNEIKNKLSIVKNMLNKFTLPKNQTLHMQTQPSDYNPSKTKIQKEKTVSKDKNKTIKVDSKAVIKTNSQVAKNILSENSNNVVNKYLRNNHNKTNSSDQKSRVGSINKKTKAVTQTLNTVSNTLNTANTISSSTTTTHMNPSSIYNINLNLNLNLNLNMLQNKNSLNSITNNTSKGFDVNERSGNVPLTERPSLINHSTSKYEKFLDKTDRMTMSSNLKTNEKYQKLSRNMNVKNFILNYGSSGLINTHEQANFNLINKKPKNIVITSSNWAEKKKNFVKKEAVVLNKVSSGSSSKTKKGVITGTVTSNRPQNKNNNANMYFKRFLNNFNSNNSQSNTNAENSHCNSLSNTQKRIIASNSSKKPHPYIDNLKYPTQGLNCGSDSNPATKSTAFNQRNIYKSNQNTNCFGKKPLSIHLKKNQFENTKEISTNYPLTSRQEKDSIKIFSNI